MCKRASVKDLGWRGGRGRECQAFWGLIAINQPFHGHLMHMLAASSLSRCLSCSPECRLGGNIPSASNVCAALFKHNCFITTLWVQSLISSHQFHPSVQRLSALLGSARSHHLHVKPKRSLHCWSRNGTLGEEPFCIVRGGRRPESQAPAPGRFATMLQSLPTWPQHTQRGSLGRNGKRQPAGPPRAALVLSNGPRGRDRYVEVRSLVQAELTTLEQACG